MQVLLAMLPAYHEHVKTHENTLITKFFGLYRVKPYGGPKVRFTARHSVLVEVRQGLVVQLGRTWWKPCSASGYRPQKSHEGACLPGNLLLKGSLRVVIFFF